jgi:hypothetical protein
MSRRRTRSARAHSLSQSARRIGERAHRDFQHAHRRRHFEHRHDLAVLNGGRVIYRGSPEAMQQQAQGKVFSRYSRSRVFNCATRYKLCSTAKPMTTFAYAFE